MTDTHSTDATTGPTHAVSNLEPGHQLVANGTIKLSGETERSEDGVKINKCAKNKQAPDTKPVPVTKLLFRYARPFDYLLLLLGTLGAILQGFTFPFLFLSLGEAIESYYRYEFGLVACNAPLQVAQNVSPCAESFLLENIDTCSNCVVNNGSFVSPNGTGGIQQYCDRYYSLFSDSGGCCAGYDRCQSIARDTLYMEVLNCLIVSLCVIGAVVLVSHYLQIAMFSIFSQRLATTLREKFYLSLLNQPISWFDDQLSGTLSTRLVDDIAKVKNGTGDKLAVVFRGLSTVVACVVISLLKCWVLTLIVVTTLPIVAVPIMLLGYLESLYATKEQAAYASAGGVAEEVLTSIRTVSAYGGERHEIERYNEKLETAKRWGLQKGASYGAAIGLLFLLNYGGLQSIAFGFAKLLFDACICDFGSSLTVVLNILVGSMVLGMGMSSVSALQTAAGSAGYIFCVIEGEERRRKERSRAELQTPLSPPKGHIQFNSVRFSYPSRPDREVLSGLSLNVSPGHRVALVGASGCGKSTILHLLLGLYAPTEGEILLDGRALGTYPAEWVRDHIGVVSQEPVLFGCSIADNIRFGKPDSSLAEIRAAARLAHADTFIAELPEGYDTLLGDRGAQLSGGQKQRVAIARAVIRDPRILLLDEATSALDTRSEAEVQAALDEVQEGRTTLVVAHRLSTIQTADTIVSLEDGIVSEIGTHSQLVAQEGLYHSLVESQTMETEVAGATQSTFQSSLPSNEINNSTPAKQAIPLVNPHQNQSPHVSFLRILSLNRPEWRLLVVGVAGGVALGLAMPVFFTLIISNLIGSFGEATLYAGNNCSYSESAIDFCPSSGSVGFNATLPPVASGDNPLSSGRIGFLIGMFAVLGVVTGVASLVAVLAFTFSSERLTKRIRSATFSAMLSQDVAWFDSPERAVGCLLVRLSHDATLIEGATSGRVSTVIQSFTTLVAGVIIAFVNSWAMSLVLLTLVPFVVFFQIIRGRVLFQDLFQDSEALEASNKIALESLENIRTVRSYNLETILLHKYSRSLATQSRQTMHRPHLIGFCSAMGEALDFWVYAMGFGWGMYLLTLCPCNPARINTTQLFGSFLALYFTTMSVSDATTFAPDYSKAVLAAKRIFAILDSKPSIDANSQSGVSPPKVAGRVTYERTHFSYPNRPSLPVLKGFNLELEPGKTVALVGESGCGKSTAISMVTRFYDPTNGMLAFDGTDLRHINVAAGRQQCAVVFQEPILFDISIEDNIRYGALFKTVTQSEVVEAAKQANIHDMVASQPLGYATRVGEKGAQLSGGEKQRVAIARGLIRRPRVLLLDEATSALDTENERVVQVALDTARAGRTTILIAHRISTVVEADLIAVVKSGRVVELGTHRTLLGRKGLYYQLVKASQKQ